MAEKMPAFQFYPGDWRKDLAVQSLDYEARGIWHELLCFMSESTQRGRLVFPDGTAMDDESIAQMLGIPEANWKQTRSKLVGRKVSGEDEDGTLFNRRMCRDEAVRDARREAGRKGGQSKQTPSKTPSKTQAKGGSSSSSSSSKHTPLPPQAGEPGEEEKPPPNSRAHGTNKRALDTQEQIRQEERARQERAGQLRREQAEAKANAAPTEEALAAIERMKALAGAGKTAPPDEPPTITEDDIPW